MKLLPENNKLSESDFHCFLYDGMIYKKPNNVLLEKGKLLSMNSMIGNYQLIMGLTKQLRILNKFTFGIL